MTIGGWIIFAILALMVLGFGICGAYLIENVAGKSSVVRVIFWR